MGSRPRAVIVGGGVNGLTAAARLAVDGWRVEVHEQSHRFGGSAASTVNDLGDGTIVDFGAAAHPFGVASPAFRALGIEGRGVRWRHSEVAMAHPLDGGRAALLHRGLSDTARGLGVDARAWRLLHNDVVDHIDDHLGNLLAPLVQWPAHPRRLVAFGPRAVLPASVLGRGIFRTEEARALLGGSAVHAVRSPSLPLTSAFGVLFNALGMTRGWPVVEGGTGRIVDALTGILREHGATLRPGSCVRDLRELPRADVTILNMTPRNVLRLSGLHLSGPTVRRLRSWRYGTGVHKVDWLLSGPVPWANAAVAQAGTVHVCGDVDDIIVAETEAARGRLPERPFVMVSQQSAADPGRGPVLWTYAHVPHGFVEKHPGQVREAIASQIERFAPGFRGVVVSYRDSTPASLEARNPAIIGGDIAGGSMGGLQSLLRPGLTLHPYRLTHGVYMASGATPPGAGVHGMSGWWAAEAALRDHPRKRVG